MRKILNRPTAVLNWCFYFTRKAANRDKTRLYSQSDDSQICQHHYKPSTFTMKSLSASRINWTGFQRTKRLFNTQWAETVSWVTFVNWQAGDILKLAVIAPLEVEAEGKAEIKCADQWFSYRSRKADIRLPLQQTPSAKLAERAAR